MSRNRFNQRSTGLIKPPRPRLHQSSRSGGLNIAYEDKDPIGSYGDANVKLLKNVSLKYDPGQKFRMLAPSGWELGDAGKRRKEFNFNEFERFYPSSTEA